MRLVQHRHAAHSFDGRIEGIGLVFWFHDFSALSELARVATFAFDTWRQSSDVTAGMTPARRFNFLVEPHLKRLSKRALKRSITLLTQIPATAFTISMLACA